MPLTHLTIVNQQQGEGGALVHLQQVTIDPNGLGVVANEGHVFPAPSLVSQSTLALPCNNSNAKVGADIRGYISGAEHHAFHPDDSDCLGSCWLFD